MNIQFALRAFWLASTVRLRKTYTANVCGHPTKREGLIGQHGNRSIMLMPLEKNGNPDYCLNCISKMSIRCAWCDGMINIGNPVTLYGVRDQSLVPEHATRYAEDPSRVVGCLRFNCAESGADRQGFWIPPGIVERVPSPLELLASGDFNGIVIVADLSNPSDIGKVIR